ncbi:MAG: molybdopterin molybdotransferase MoeA [Sphingomonas sp.]
MTTAAPLSVAEAQCRLLALASPVSAHVVPLMASIGHWAAADIVARYDRPTDSVSAMDGYAIRHADLPGPWSIIGESAAGHPLNRAIAPGEAARIFTGAVVPAGTDTVVVQEDVASDGDVLRITKSAGYGRGQHIRQAGADFRAAATLIAKGARLSPARIALAATAGYESLYVNRPIRVTLIATGDELRAPGQSLEQGQLPESNSVMLAAILRALPVTVTDLGLVPDRLDALTTAFAGCAGDIIVTTGGASVGDHDLVRPALKAAGGSVDFWRIALRPGKPMLAGTLGTSVVLGLPGNPVSAFVTAHVFLAPLIAAFGGASHCIPHTRHAELGAALSANDSRQDYLRATWQGGTVIPAAMQDSAMLTTLAAADCLIVRAPHAPAAKQGDMVDILPIA